MGWYAGLAPLRNLLADLYPTASIARVIATEAGIAEQLIDFDGAAVEFWKSILTIAHHNGQVQALIDVARKHFPKNEALTEAERFFQETPVPDLSRLVEAPTFDGGSNIFNSGSENTIITISGDNNGIIGGRDVKNAKIQRRNNKA